MYNYTDSLELGPNHCQPIQIRGLQMVSPSKTLYEDLAESDRSAPGYGVHRITSSAWLTAIVLVMR